MPVGDRTPQPGRQPESREQRGDLAAAWRAAAAAARGTLAWLIVLLLVASGVGWLYLLRHVAALDIGPPIGGALPLEQLAGEAAQPLGRMAAAWVPTGAAAGIVLGLLTNARVAARLLGLTVASFAVLFVASAASDAVAQNERLMDHLTAPLTPGGIWAAVLLVVTGSLLAEVVLPAAPRASGAAAAG